MPEAPVLSSNSNESKNNFHFGKIGLEKVEPDINNIENRNKELIQDFNHTNTNQDLNSFKHNTQNIVNNEPIHNQIPVNHDIPQKSINNNEQLFSKIEENIKLKEREKKYNRNNVEPIFIETKDHEKMIKDLESINKNVAVIESKFNSIIHIKDQEDSKINKLASTCEELQKKLLYIDKVVFEIRWNKWKMYQFMSK